MEPIIATIISTLAFGLLALVYKRLRERGVQTLSVMGLGAFCVPAWALLSILLMLRGDMPKLTMPYVASLLVWLLVVFLWNWGSKYLYAHKSLTELKSYSLAIGIIVGVVVDALFFRTTLNFPIFTATALFLTGGVLLSKKAYGGEARVTQSLPLRTVIGVLTINAVLAVVATAAYKYSLELQQNILHQIVFTQSFLYGAFFIFSAGDIAQKIRGGAIAKQEVFLISVLIFVATFFEVFMVKNLPLTVLAAVSVIPLVIFSFYDFTTGYLRLSAKNVAAVLLVAVGLLTLQM